LNSGPWHANESVDITAKSSAGDGHSFRRGQQAWRRARRTDAAQVRLDRRLPGQPGEARRSSAGELYTTKVLSDAQLEQIEAAFKGNEARVASNRARVADTVIRAPFAGRVGLRRVSVGSLISPGTVITTLDDTSTIKLDFTFPETFLTAVSQVSGSRRAASPTRTRTSVAR
jgi:membrane fusion protein (multidrug efflux system)